MDVGWEDFDLWRVKKQIKELALIGGTVEKGTTRLAFTSEDMQAKKYVEELMVAAGMNVQYDPVANLIGIYQGIKPELPAVIMGSHLDTVTLGGRYDGVAGVLTAIEIVRSFYVAGIRPLCSLVVIAFTDEEGARFGGSLFGSRALTGMLNDQWFERIDQQGIKLREAMFCFGFYPVDLEKTKIQPEQYKAYLELHIEQGRVLEEANCPVGIVTGIAAPIQLWAVIEGSRDHAGATPMGQRKDALTAAAELILAVESICTPQEVGQLTVGTVGSVTVFPNVLNVIPGKVRLSIDIRDVNSVTRAKAVSEIKQRAQKIAQTRDIKISIEEILAIEPVKLDEQLIGLLEKKSQELNLSYRKLISGAGHDAMLVAKIMPAAMIFIRCRRGISHSPEEYVAENDLYLAAKLLYYVLMELGFSE